jgi:hypothetical protein
MSSKAVREEPSLIWSKRLPQVVQALSEETRLFFGAVTSFYYNCEHEGRGFQCLI